MFYKLKTSIKPNVSKEQLFLTSTNYEDPFPSFLLHMQIVEEQERQDELIAASLVKKTGSGRAASGKAKKATGGRKVEVKKTVIEKKPKEPSKAALKKAKDAFGFDTDSVKSEESSTTAAAPAKSKVKEEAASSSTPTIDVDAEVKSETENNEPLSLADRLKRSMYYTQWSYRPFK